MYLIQYTQAYTEQYVIYTTVTVLVLHSGISYPYKVGLVNVGSLKSLNILHIYVWIYI